MSEATPHGLLCFTTTADGSENSRQRPSAASRSRMLLYESCLPPRTSADAMVGRFVAVRWSGAARRAGQRAGFLRAGHLGGVGAGYGVGEIITAPVQAGG